jgi:hypothetical protein
MGKMNKKLKTVKIKWLLKSCYPKIINIRNNDSNDDHKSQMDKMGKLLNLKKL